MTQVCYWCRKSGKTEPKAHLGQVRDFHPRCWSQVEGLDYTPTDLSAKDYRVHKEKLPEDEFEQSLYLLGGRTRVDVHRDDKGQYVFMANGKHGLYKHHL